MTLDDVEPEVRAIVERVSRRLFEQGAKATLLAGSHARGRARPNSDIDLFAVGDGPDERVEVVDEQMVSVHWFTPEEVRQRLASPHKAFIAVHGWKDAIVVDDPADVGRELQREARDWSWDKLSSEADAAVVDELVVWAEYVRKLVGALEARRELDAAALTAETALRIGKLVALRRRVTAESENGLWDAIADAAPPEWGEELRRAVRSRGEDLDTGAAAALRLFALVAADVDELLDDRQRGVVSRAVAAATELRL